MASVEQSLQDEKTPFRELRQTNCRCLVEYDSMLVEKDGEIEELNQQLRAQSGSTEAHPAIALPFAAIVSSPRGVGHQGGEHRPCSSIVTNPQGESAASGSIYWGRLGGAL